MSGRANAAHGLEQRVCCPMLRTEELDITMTEHDPDGRPDGQPDGGRGGGPPPVTIYTTMLCPYCHRAKHLLKRKGVTYNEIDVTLRPQERAVMRDRAGGRHTVPQIFIGERHVGGCDDLYALDIDGRLDELLDGKV